MASSSTLLKEPKEEGLTIERDIRVEDWLNDKIQTDVDLSSTNLDSLLLSVFEQKKLLDEQLKNVEMQLYKAKRASEAKRARILLMNTQYQEKKALVERQLVAVTSSTTPKEAVQRLERPLEKLRKLELAGYYVDLLNEVQILVNEACGHLPANPKEALIPYARLKQLAISLQSLQEPAEGAGTHLVAYVQDASSRLWEDMKRILVVEFEETLDETSWPNVDNPPSRKWSDSFEKLLDLQGPEIMAAREPLVLLPMSVLVKPFLLQFKFHFLGDTPTNNPKNLGQFFFTWFLGIVDKWEDFFRENVGPILAAHFRTTPFAGNRLYVDPVTALITALLPAIREKIDNLTPQISNDPQLLSQFINELLAFDRDVREKFDYDAGNAQYGWKGLAWDFLETWFDRWLEIEKDYAMTEYWAIVKDADSPIDYDSAGPGKTKPTFEAIKVTNLVSAVTERYNKLRKFSHKTKFLITIQAEILDQYVERLKSALDFYTAANSAVGRTLHGVTKEELVKLEGIGGLETLCRVLGSADHFISKLKDWANQPFFVDLWDQLQGRAKETSAEDKLAGGMTYNEVKEVTSDSLGSKDDGTVFDVTIDVFQRQKDRAENLIRDFLKYSFPTILKQYIIKPQWTTIEDTENSLPATITAELDQPLQVLKTYFSFLHTALSNTTFRKICRISLASLQNTLFNDVLLKQDFTALGAARFQFDVYAIQDVINSITVPASFPLLRLKNAAKLLNLKVVDGERMPLKEACKDIYLGTNDVVEERLKREGIMHITHLEAKSILLRRVENTYEFGEEGGGW